MIKQLAKSALCIVALAAATGVSAASVPVIDGVFSVDEWTGHELSIGTPTSAVPGFTLPKVYGLATDKWLYMGFEAVGAISGSDLAMNIGADRALNPGANPEDAGAWSYALEVFAPTTGVLAAIDAKYKYNDRDLDGPGLKTRDKYLTVEKGPADYMMAIDNSNLPTQIVEYKISMSEIATAFGRTYDNGIIGVGDQLKLVGFFNQVGWNPIPYGAAGLVGTPAFGDLDDYLTLTVVAEEAAAVPTPSAALAGVAMLGALAMRRRRRGNKA